MFNFETKLTNNWSQYSKEAEHVLKLKLLLDTIEGYIFSIPGLSDEYEAPGRIYVNRERIPLPNGNNTSWRSYKALT